MNTSGMQAIFNTATAALIAQGKRSSSGTGCLYRGPENLKCAIGHVMTDEQMTRFRVQNYDAADCFPQALIGELIPDLGNDVEHGRNFLAALQNAHDSSSQSDFVDDFKKSANEVAAKYDLTPIE